MFPKTLNIQFFSNDESKFGNPLNLKYLLPDYFVLSTR